MTMHMYRSYNDSLMPTQSDFINTSVWYFLPYITVESSAVLLQPLDKCRLLCAVSGDSRDDLITTDRL